MKKIVIFASGQGSNAENIILHFNKKGFANVVAIFTNNPNAKVLQIAKNNNIESLIFNKTELNEGFVLDKLNVINPDLIVLAGFLWKFPEPIIDVYTNKIINIHPALLPKYGGKGMYGMNVHNAVLENNEPESGITIHYVTKNYDEGTFIFQKSVSIIECKSADEIAKKIHELEMDNFPKVIAEILNPKSKI
jgi:phosphoribosylglycinamide formyltransferase 1